MENGTQCPECLEALPPECTAAEPRVPCPSCGSVRRQIALEARTATLNVTLGNATLTSTATVHPLLSSLSLLLQTVVELGPKESEGNRIIAVAPAWGKIIELLSKDPAAAFKIDPRKWEEIIAGAYDEAGFDEVILTPRSADFGRDVIATKRGLGRVRIIDQVKAYGPNHRVTADDVRALMGVLHCDGASKGFVTTTSTFAPGIKTDPLIVPLMPSRLELIDGELLLARLEELAGIKP